MLQPELKMYFHTYVKDNKTRKLSIGVDMHGWVFNLYTHPRVGIHDWVDWSMLLPVGEIIDSYDNVIPFEEMINIVTCKPPVENEYTHYMVQSNSAIYDKKIGLLRNTLHINFIAHGPGTWDIVQPRFDLYNSEY